MDQKNELQPAEEMVDAVLAAADSEGRGPEVRAGGVGAATGAIVGGFVGGPIGAAIGGAVGGAVGYLVAAQAEDR